LTGYAVIAVGLFSLLAIFVSNRVVESVAEESTVARELIEALEGNLEFQSLALMLLGACFVALFEPRIQGVLRNAETGAAGLLKQVDGRIVLGATALLAIVLVVG
jgi:hypothetical protein